MRQRGKRLTSKLCVCVCLECITIAAYTSTRTKAYEDIKLIGHKQGLTKPRKIIKLRTLFSHHNNNFKKNQL